MATKLTAPTCYDSDNSVIKFSQVDHATYYNILVDGATYGTYNPPLTSYTIVGKLTNCSFSTAPPSSIQKWHRAVVKIKANTNYKFTTSTVVKIEGAPSSNYFIDLATNVITINVIDPESNVIITASAVSTTPKLATPNLNYITGNRLYGSSVSNATSYTIKAGDTEIGSSSTLNDVDLTQLLNFNKLSPSTKYEIRAKATAVGYNDSDWSNPLSYTTPTKQLGTPQNLTIEGKQLSWSKVSSTTDGGTVPNTIAIDYNIYAKTSTTDYIKLGTTNRLFVENIETLAGYSSLTKEETYQISVTASSTATGYTTSEHSNTVDYTVPNFPQLSSPVIQGTSETVLSWSAVTTDTEGNSIKQGTIVTYSISVDGAARTTTTNLSIDLANLSLTGGVTYTIGVSATAEEYLPSSASEFSYTAPEPPTPPTPEPSRFWVYGGLYKLKDNYAEFPISDNQLSCVLNCVVIKGNEIQYNQQTLNSWVNDGGTLFVGNIDIASSDKLYFGFSGQEIICKDSSGQASINSAKSVYEWFESNVEEIVDISAKNYIRLKVSSVDELLDSIPNEMVTTNTNYPVRLTSYAGFETTDGNLFIEDYEHNLTNVEQWGNLDGTDMSDPAQHIEYVQPAIDCSYPTLGLSDNLQTKFIEMMGYQLGLESDETSVEYHDYGHELIQSWYESVSDTNGEIYLFKDTVEFTEADNVSYSFDAAAPSEIYTALYDANDKVLLPSFEAMSANNVTLLSNIYLDSTAQSLRIFQLDTETTGGYRTIQYLNGAWGLRTSSGYYSSYSVPVYNRVVVLFNQKILDPLPEWLTNCTQSTYSGVQEFVGQIEYTYVQSTNSARRAVRMKSRARLVALSNDATTENWKVDLSIYAKYTNLTPGEHPYIITASSIYTEDYETSSPSEQRKFKKLPTLTLMIGTQRVKAIYSGNKVVKAIYLGETKVYDGALRITVIPYSSSSNIEFNPSALEVYTSDPDAPLWVTAYKDGAVYTDVIYEGFQVYQGPNIVTDAPIDVVQEGSAFGIVVTEIRAGETYIVKLIVS